MSQLHKSPTTLTRIQASHIQQQHCKVKPIQKVQLLVKLYKADSQ
uniref:Uncharacterized protein n=1 Tax=Anguilla anguilla TaxID=7936 RepID=A0A0E9UQM6_ANGAN